MLGSIKAEEQAAVTAQRKNGITDGFKDVQSTFIGNRANEDKFGAYSNMDSMHLDYAT